MSQETRAAMPAVRSPLSAMPTPTPTANKIAM